MIARLPAGWHSPGDEYDGCSRYAYSGGIQPTLSPTHSLAYDCWLSRLYAPHLSWSYCGFPAGLCVLAHGLSQWVLTHTGECACLGADWPLHHVLSQSLYGNPAALHPGLRGGRAAHCLQKTWPMGAFGNERFSRRFIRL